MWIKGGTYRHGQNRVGRLETVGPFFPQISISLNGYDVATDSVSGFRHNHVGSDVTVLGGQSLGNAKPANAASHDHAIHNG